MNQSFALRAAVLVAGCLLAGMAQARDQMQPVFGVGLTGGGETLVTVPFQDGSSQKISSGGQVHLYGGLRLPVMPRFAVQATIGYHFDNVSASNGSVRFSRFPVELLGQFDVAPQVRLNGGVRFATGTKVTSSGVASGLDTSFSASPGLVLEGEYLFSDNISAALRYVNETYKAPNGVKIDGGHVGGYVKFMF
ncbi:MAG: hypothetical protein RLY71_2254 [Pseudomonadota bacterium]|jgi:hypothetical protein